MCFNFSGQLAVTDSWYVWRAQVLNPMNSFHLSKKMSTEIEIQARSSVSKQGVCKNFEVMFSSQINEGAECANPKSQQYSK